MRLNLKQLLLLAGASLLMATVATNYSVTPSRAGSETTAATATKKEAQKDLESVVVAGGCFWCIESDFDKVPGVVATTSGYSGGTTTNPTYRSVSHGNAGHMEVVKIDYDPKVVSFERLMEIFWRSIDPTDARGQFCDKGPSYLTAIFVQNTVQRGIVEGQKKAIEASGQLPGPIATKIRDAVPFYPAEGYHQDFYKKSPLRYYSYRAGCRRDATVKRLWGEDSWGGTPHS